jgi:hypothetical protein
MKKTKVDLTQEDFPVVEEKHSLKDQLISDLTGLPEWDVKSAPSYIWELADHLLDLGWTK